MSNFDEVVYDILTGIGMWIFYGIAFVAGWVAMGWIIG